MRDSAIFSNMACGFRTCDLKLCNVCVVHYGDVIMGTSQITILTIVYSTVYSGADQRKYQSSASLVFVRGIHRGPVNSPHKWPATWKMFPFDDVINNFWYILCYDFHSFYGDSHLVIQLVQVTGLVNFFKLPNLTIKTILGLRVQNESSPVKGQYVISVMVVKLVVNS